MYDEIGHMLVGNSSNGTFMTTTTLESSRRTDEHYNGDVVAAVATPKADAKQTSSKNIPVTIAPASTLLLSPTSTMTTSTTTTTTPPLSPHSGHDLAANMMFGDGHDNNVITYTDRSNISKKEALLLISKKRSSSSEQNNDDDDDEDDATHPDGCSTSDEQKKKKKKRKRRNSSSQCSTSSSKTKIPFPITLYRMLYELEMESINSGVVVEDENKIVYWQSHGRAFIVRHPKEFVSKIIPRFFKLSKYASFQRQLNLYGFRRMTNGYDNGCYYHEYFLRGKPYLLDFIIRTKIKGNGIKRSITASPVLVQEHALSAGQEQEVESKSSCDANVPSLSGQGADSKKLESSKATGISSSEEEESPTGAVTTVVEPDLYAYPPLPNFDASTSTLSLQSPVPMSATTAAATEEQRQFSSLSSTTMTIRSPVPFVEAAAVDSMQTSGLFVPHAEPITATPVFTRPALDGMMQQSSLLTFPQQQHTTALCDNMNLANTQNVMYHQVTPDHPAARSRQASSAFETHKKKKIPSNSSIIGSCNTTRSAVLSPQDEELQLGDDRSASAAAAVATVAPSLPSLFPDCLMIPSVMDQDDMIAKEHQMFKPLKALKVMNPYNYPPAPFSTTILDHEEKNVDVIMPTMISPDPSPVQEIPIMTKCQMNDQDVTNHGSDESASVAAEASPPLTKMAVDTHCQHSTSTVASSNATEQVVVPQDDNDDDEDDDEEEDTIVLTFEGMKFHYLDPLFFNPRRHHFGLMEPSKRNNKTDTAVLLKANDDYKN